MNKIIITNKNGEQIVLGNQAPYFLELFEGAGEVGVIFENQKAPKQDGSTYLGNTLENRAIAIEGTIVTRGEENMVTARRQMQRVLNPKAGEVVITYHQGTQVKEITGIVEKTPIFPGGRGNKGLYYQKFLLHLICHQPFWRDIAKTKAEVAIWRGVFEFPLEIFEEGIEMGYREPSLIVNIFNKGDVPCGMKIKFKALATVENPSLFNVNTREFIQINKTLTAGEVLTVTTHFANKRVEVFKNGIVSNAFNWIDLDSTFLQLNPGDNLLRYDADDGIDSLNVDIYYNPLYVGV